MTLTTAMAHHQSHVFDSQQSHHPFDADAASTQTTHAAKSSVEKASAVLSDTGVENKRVADQSATTVGRPPSPSPPAGISLSFDNPESATSLQHQQLESLQRDSNASRRLSRRLPSWVSRNTSAAPTSQRPSSTSRSSQKRVPSDDDDDSSASGPSPNTQSPSSGLTAALTGTATGEQPRDLPGGRVHARSVGGLPLTQCPPIAVQPSHKQASSASLASLSTLTIGDESPFKSEEFTLKQADSCNSSSRDLSIAEDTSTGAGLNPIVDNRRQRKMHQTSSRLLRMTDDDRPFTRVSKYSYRTGTGEGRLYIDGLEGLDEKSSRKLTSRCECAHHRANIHYHPPPHQISHT